MRPGKQPGAQGERPGVVTMSVKLWGLPAGKVLPSEAQVERAVKKLRRVWSTSRLDTLGRTEDDIRQALLERVWTVWTRKPGESPGFYWGVLQMASRELVRDGMRENERAVWATEAARCSQAWWNRLGSGHGAVDRLCEVRQTLEQVEQVAPGAMQRWVDFDRQRGSLPKDMSNMCAAAQAWV